MKSAQRTLIIILVLTAACTGRKSSEKVMLTARQKFVDSLVNVMTIEEKVGQLNFYKGDGAITGPMLKDPGSGRFDQLAREGMITGLFNTHGAAFTAQLQKIAVEESRLGIPLLFGADIIHGFKTVFPIPLASAASWDLQAIEEAERIAAVESTAAGINFNFAPMVDIARDPRWGRVAEGAGEDPFLGSMVAAARVRGMQGEALSDPTTMAACIKHFAAYGAPAGGRDYNTVDMSPRMLREMYLPPYRAGVAAGAATLMTSFNDLNGIPATGNKRLLRQILRGEWGFKGMIVSDWQSIGEMIEHGYSEDSLQAAVQALEAGVDMDMMSDIYLKKIPELIAAGRLDVSLVDDAVRRVLRLKWDLGLFEDPYRYSDPSREQLEIRTAAHLAKAREVAKKSIVLLKNQDQLLPISKTGKKIGVIGPLADSPADMNGTWSFFGEAGHAVTFLEGIRSVAGEENVEYAAGCEMYTDSDALIGGALRVARRSDVVVAVLGESAVMNGEGASRSDIRIPANQMRMLQEVTKTGKPIVVVVMTGRPLDISWIHENIPAILLVWTLGSESGHAAADVIFGDYNPSAKLPVTFPRSVGQIPIYYNHPNTGRPYTGDYSEPGSARVYKSRYRDVENSPLYPFGYGLSYTTFEYSNFSLEADTLRPRGKVKASVTVTNTGDVAGEEVVQLYIRDLAASIVRPVKELKGFQKVSLEPGESTEVSFTLVPDTFAFYQENLQLRPEAGEFRIFIGGKSDVEDSLPFYYVVN